MEKFVLSLCGLWFWLTRKRRTNLYSQVAGSLNSAHKYLSSDFDTRASTRDRGFLLPHQAEAIAILERHGAHVSHTSCRFASLIECCRFVTEELTATQPVVDVPHVAAPQQVVFAPAAIMATRVVAEPVPSPASFAAFWSSEGSGIPGRFGSVTFSHSTIVRAFTRSGDSLSQLASNSAKPQVR
jgi:hypothetical protein